RGMTWTDDRDDGAKWVQGRSERYIEDLDPGPEVSHALDADEREYHEQYGQGQRLEGPVAPERHDEAECTAGKSRRGRYSQNVKDLAGGDAAEEHAEEKNGRSRGKESSDEEQTGHQ